MSQPLELANVQRDDGLLDCIGLQQPFAEGTDAVAAALVRWRSDIYDGDPRPVFAPVAPSTVPVYAASSRQASRPQHPGRSGPRRSVRPVLGGLIMVTVVLSASGIAAAAARATPGSVLWPVTQVVAARHAHSIEARDRVLRALATAQKQAVHGNKKAARVTLNDAIGRVDEVQAADGKWNLQVRVAALSAALDGSGGLPVKPQPGATTPPTPPASPSPDASPSPSPAPSPSDIPSPDPSPSADSTPGATHAPAPSAPGDTTGTTGTTG